MIYALISYAILILILGVYVLTSLRDDGWRKYTGPVLYFSIVGLSLYTYNQTLGFCKPMWLQLKQPELSVLAIAIEEPKNIYVWGYEVEKQEPACLILPYSEQQVRQAQEGVANMEHTGEGLVFGPNAEGEMKFHPKPIEALPEKGGQ